MERNAHLKWFELKTYVLFSQPLLDSRLPALLIFRPLQASLLVTRNPPFQLLLRHKCGQIQENFRLDQECSAHSHGSLQASRVLLQNSLSKILLHFHSAG
jgi:hypothetical protein